MPKLQRYKAYSYKGKQGKQIPHYKNSLNLPDEILDKLGWSKGEELDFEVEGNTLKVKPIREVLRRQLEK